MNKLRNWTEIYLNIILEYNDPRQVIKKVLLDNGRSVYKRVAYFIFKSTRPAAFIIAAERKPGEKFLFICYNKFFYLKRICRKKDFYPYKISIIVTFMLACDSCSSCTPNT